MTGIFTTTAYAATLDECPMAYKPMEDILKHITATVRVNHVIRPIYNFKGSEQQGKKRLAKAEGKGR